MKVRTSVNSSSSIGYTEGEGCAGAEPFRKRNLSSLDKPEPGGEEFGIGNADLETGEAADCCCCGGGVDVGGEDCCNVRIVSTVAL
jgi:hypothetical protein